MTAEEKLKLCLERHPEWTDARITKTAKGANVAMVKAMRAGLPLPPAPPPKVSISPAAPNSIVTFSLSGVRLLSKKPLDQMKLRLYSLDRGVGYKIDGLCHTWGCSEDSLRDHAKRYGALRYVEATPGEYVACIVHPETPNGE
jgi:hypothetical protein